MNRVATVENLHFADNNEIGVVEATPIVDINIYDSFDDWTDMKDPSESYHMLCRDRCVNIYDTSYNSIVASKEFNCFSCEDFTTAVFNIIEDYIKEKECFAVIKSEEMEFCIKSWNAIKTMRMKKVKENK